MVVAEYDLSSFGSLLKAFRTRRHLTQEQLARLIGVHRSAVIRWERGDFLPESKAMVLELARHLRLDDQETRRLLEASLTALTPHWSVPLPRNPYFTGREEVLAALHTSLSIDHVVALTQSYALHGLGGVGKTQIVLEYAYRYALSYRAVFWIGAETNEQIMASFLHVAEVLQLPEREGQDEGRMIAAVQRWLLSHDQWLLIWDNLEQVDLLPRFLPPTQQGAVLLTTRHHALGTLAHGLELSPMKQAEGIVLLLRRAKIVPAEASHESIHHLQENMPAEYAAAEELVTVLGGLPLALDQAGAYIEETQCGVPAYLELFRTQQVFLLQHRGAWGHDHPESVFTTFRLALRATIERHPAAGDLLQVCALLQPEAIPEELFLQGATYLGETFEAVCHDVFTWNQVVASACAYALLHRHPRVQTVSMHRLVQAVLKDILNDTDRCTWQRRILSAMSYLFPSDETRRADYWHQCERLLPHALVCLTWSEEETLRITLAGRVAKYLSERARYAEAEALYLQTIHLGELTLGVDRSPVSEVLSGLADLYRKQGKYAEVEALYLRAIHLGEQTLGADHPQVATALQGLAGFYRDQGKYAEAEALYQRALGIQEHALGTEHPQLATALQGLAVLYGDQGKYTASEPLYQRVLSIRERTLGADHPQVAVGLNNLAADYVEQGRYVEAEPLFRRALDIWEQALGPEHPRLAHPLNNLAELYREQGRYLEAEPLLRRALCIWEQALGSEHRLVALVLNSLAKLSQEQGKHSEADTLFQHALSIQERSRGPQHPETAETLHDLALFRKIQGNLSEASSLAKRALQIRVQSLGDTHPKTTATRTLLAQLEAEPKTAREGSSCPNHGRTAHIQEKAVITPQKTGDGFPSGSDPLQGFLDTCCELHPRAWCRSAEIWQAYQCWVQSTQEPYPLSRGEFITQLKNRGFRADRTKAARIWRGIALTHANGDAG